MLHIRHWSVGPLFGLTASMIISLDKTPVRWENTHGPDRVQLTSLTFKLVTNTDAEDEKSTSPFVTKITLCQGLKETAYLLANKPERPVSPITTFSTILFHLLSVEIKQRKVANLESKQSHRNWARCYHRWLRVRWLSNNLSLQTRPLILKSGPDTANNEMGHSEKTAVFAVEVASAEGSASIFFHKKDYLYVTDQTEWGKTQDHYY